MSIYSRFNAKQKETSIVQARNQKFFLGREDRQRKKNTFQLVTTNQSVPLPGI